MERLFARQWLEVPKLRYPLMLCAKVGALLRLCRFLSSSEVSTALRPFYFSVHPDLFGRYPVKRTVNENSLKELSYYIETLLQNRPTVPTTVTFYLRNQNTPDSGIFRLVTISLVHRDLRNTILTILKTCDLPTTYVDNIKPSPAKSRFEGLDMKEAKFDENDPVYGSVNLKQEIKKFKGSEILTAWLESNVTEALKKLAACQPVREELVRLQKVLCDTLGIESVVWDCGWSVTHCRGCLLSFQTLALHYPDLMHTLQGRKLIFGNDTGVSLDGHVVLNSGEVRNNWLDLIKNVHKQDEARLRIPAFERAMSRVLCDIKVVRRKFQPKVMAKQYENQLRRLTTSLSDHQGRMVYPKDWPPSLSNFELVVETEVDPLMLSPTGQFIVPSSCPAFLLITFISEHLDEASRLLQRYQSNKHVECDLHQQCMEEFELAALQKDDNITPDLMIECCDRLLRQKTLLSPLLKGVHLWVTNYYSVMSDGEMCVPWNWKL